MKLYKGIFAKVLAEYMAEMLDMTTVDISDLVESECCRALEEIRRVIKDEDTSDTECFKKIEEIIEIYEELGCDCGSRHDFG